MQNTNKIKLNFKLILVTNNHNHINIKLKELDKKITWPKLKELIHIFHFFLNLDSFNAQHSMKSCNT